MRADTITRIKPAFFISTRIPQSAQLVLIQKLTVNKKIKRGTMYYFDIGQPTEKHSELNDLHPRFFQTVYYQVPITLFEFNVNAEISRTSAQKRTLLFYKLLK